MPRPRTVQQVRYWIVVALRAIAMCLFVWAALAALGVLGQVVSTSLSASTNLFEVGYAVVFGPGVLFGVGATLVYLAPRIARWIAPLVSEGCPQCSYPVPAGASTCPECGVRVN